MDSFCLGYKETGYFTKTVTDYLEDQPDLRSFYQYRPDLKGFAQLFNDKKVTADRNLLVKVLTEQYTRITAVNEKAVIPRQNIADLANENTFTITTGHQLNLFAGPLYFIYKIVTAIKLSAQLKAAFPDKNFIPVYWMATEDHDFAEINYTNVGGKKVQWNLDAKGATGRLDLKSIREALNQYKGVLGIEGFGAELADIMETAYGKFTNLADATRYLANALFGQYGLIVIDADDTRLKKQFAPIITSDIIEQNSFKNIKESVELMQTLHIPIQVNPREINFFYLNEGLRERIIFENDAYKVLNTEISFDEVKLKEEINQHPERFSPNVAMRPVYQEYILPNLAYIGGGGELVYWLELKSTFDHYQINYPVLVLRNSALIVRKETAVKVKNMKLAISDLFKPTDAIKSNWIKKNTDNELSLGNEWQQFNAIFNDIKARAGKVDQTLVPSAGAVEARLKHALDKLEGKLLRAEKRNYDTRLAQIDGIKAELFPSNGLQERNENFGMFYVKWGQRFIDELINNFEPLDFEFTVLSE